MSFKLVRKSREGRQTEDEIVHIINEGVRETYCGKHSSRKVRNVRTLSVFTGDAPICPECNKVMKDII